MAMYRQPWRQPTPRRAFFASAGAVVSGTITLTDLTNLRVYQRNGTSASITVTGTYTGTPTAIQARIVQDGTSTEVVTWTTIDAAPSAGTFSGSITVGQGGWYNVQVRFSNDTGVTSNGSNKFGVGIVVLMIGQSNSELMFTQGTNTSPSLVSKHSGSAFPSTVGTWATLGTTAQGAEALGSALVAQYGIPVGLLNYAVSGSAMNTWDGTGDTNYRNAKQGVIDSGGAVEYVSFIHGETDATSGTTQASYEIMLGTMTTNLRADITNRSTKTNLPILLALLGRGSTMTSDANVEAIRAAQLSRVAALSDVYLSMITADLDLQSDHIHKTGASFAQQGQRLAECIKFLLGTVSTYRGPSIAGATVVDSTHTDVSIVHQGGTDFTPTSGINGFEIDDGGSIVVPSAAVRQDATTIRLTHTALSGGSPTVRYLYGLDGGVTYADAFSGEVVDNTSLALPLENALSVAITPNIVINSTVGNAVAAGVSSVINQAVNIASTPGNAVAAGVASTITLSGSTVARPISDVSAGTWTPSTGTDLFAMIDEVSADDTDYISSTSAGTCSLGLNSVTDPLASTGHVFKYRAWAPTTGGLVVKLKQGTTVIATWTHATLPTSPTTYTQTLSGAEADAITDYTALRVDFEATV